MNSIDVYNENVSLGQVTAILFRRKWQLLATFLLVLVCVACVTLLLPKQYEARMKILVKNDRANMVVSAGSTQSSSPAEVSETQINTEIELLDNDDLLEQVVTSCGLDRLEPTGATPDEEQRQGALERAVRQLRQSLKIVPVRKADIIEVDYTANDRHQAVLVLKQLAALYFEAHLRVHGTPGTHEFFLSQTERYGKELRDAEAKLADFRERNDIVLFPEQKQETMTKGFESKSNLLITEAAIHEHTLKTANLRSQLAAVEPRVITQSRTISNQYTVERLATMLVELQNHRTQLLAKFLPDDRLVLENAQEIADTEAALERSKALTGLDQATDVNPLRQTLELDLAKEEAELAGLEARRVSLVQQTKNYGGQLTKLGASTTQYEDLIRKQKEAEDNYLLYARKTEEARIAESLDQQKISNVAIAENPVEPRLPSKPNVPLDLAFGAVLAALLSSGLAFALEYRKQASTRADGQVGIFGAIGAQPSLELVEHSNDLEALTGLPVLAITNHH
jgi:uncharacterized protein involved in exopolysaccharide biosynthesis